MRSRSSSSWSRRSSCSTSRRSRARRAGRARRRWRTRCPDARAGSLPRASRTAFATPAERGRPRPCGGHGRRGRSCPTRTRPTGSSCCALQPGPGDVISGARRHRLRERRQARRHHDEAVPEADRSRTSSTSSSATTARRRSTAARSARCSETPSTRRSSRSTGRCETSRSASTRPPAPRPAPSPATDSHRRRRLATDCNLPSSRLRRVAARLVTGCNLAS